MKRAMSILEYCILLVLVVAAMIGMQIYLKRAISGRWKSVGDTFGSGRQYNPVSPQQTDITGGG